MASLIQQGLDKIVAQAFAGKLYNGTLRKETVASLDEFGDPVAGAITDYTFNGIRDNISAWYASNAGIPLTDVKILIIARSLPDGIEPVKDDKIFIRGQWHQIRKIMEVDPANATFSLACFVIDSQS